MGHKGKDDAACAVGFVYEERLLTLVLTKGQLGYIY